MKDIRSFIQIDIRSFIQIVYSNCFYNCIISREDIFNISLNLCNAQRYNLVIFMIFHHLLTYKKPFPLPFVKEGNTKVIKTVLNANSTNTYYLHADHTLS